MDLTFIKYEQALEILAQNKASFPVVSVPLKEAGGHFLAEDLVADRDFPPYHRVTMDGIAIQYSSFAEGKTSFPIQGVAPAGAPQKTLEHADQCIEVMTGAILPNEADTVIRYEDLDIKDGAATIQIDQLSEKQNVHFKGIDIQQGTIIKKAGERISSAEISVAAATGRAHLLVRKLPKIVIISTGDELVDVHEKPLEHQIRRSNGYGIRNTLSAWGMQADLLHLPDDKQEMEAIIGRLLIDYDVLIVTGGVSKGKFDFLPDVLSKLGVKKLFHKIQQRPGKPLWFGTKGADTHVFGLPGNPVSAFVCVQMYFRYWLLTSLGVEDQPWYVELTEDVTFNPDLVYFLEAKLTSGPNGILKATPIKGNGSGDFVNLVYTDGFLRLPQGKNEFKKGEVYPFILYRKNL